MHDQKCEYLNKRSFCSDLVRKSIVLPSLLETRKHCYELLKSRSYETRSLSKGLYCIVLYCMFIDGTLSVYDIG